MATTVLSRRLGVSLCARFYSAAAASSSLSAAAAASGEIRVQDFVKSIKGVEAHADKVAQAIIRVPTLLQTRSNRLKKLGIPCKQRKMLLRYTEKYRQGIWTPRMSTKH
ncbi:hypothetical protein KC19_VG144200 [Ceratodon purpureus]|uniref:Small ribosomal subunit protein mS41 SAM domain-containing protein n=1 Tax=Ceratodon purpureus TaxID=3225 RepID=A0A8T0HR72_CERPU|nr:hypothetical protein KC19_VG144200 [Ceratodon purpureus]